MADEPKEPSKRRQIRIKTEYDEWAEQEANRQGRTFSNFINWLLGKAKKESEQSEKKDQK